MYDVIKSISQRVDDQKQNIPLEKNTCIYKLACPTKKRSQIRCTPGDLFLPPSFGKSPKNLCMKKRKEISKGYVS